MTMPFLFCLAAALLYAAEMVTQEKMLPKTSSIVLTFFFGLGIALYALPFVIVGSLQSNLIWPETRTEWLWIIIIPLLGFLADWSHFEAINKQAGSVLLATFYLLIPISASILKFEAPSNLKILAWTFGFISLLLLAREGDVE